VWFQDEACVGQQGTLTRKWARRGTRPRARRDTRYKWSYIFGAELTASNITNANTKGYGKKMAILSAHLGSGGVDILGVKRFQDAGLLSDRRLASAGLENSDAKQSFFEKNPKSFWHC
jgi:hypothetical protein